MNRLPSLLLIVFFTICCVTVAQGRLAVPVQEQYEIKEIVQVETNSTWCPGIIIGKQGKNYYKVRFVDIATAEKKVDFFFPPEIKKTNGLGFEPVAAEFRTWNSTKGTQAVAKLAFCDGENVILQRKTKAVIVAIDLLSDDDKQHVDKMREMAKTLARDNPDRTGPTPLKELIGMDKDEILDKLQKDQQQMLRELENSREERSTENQDGRDRPDQTSKDFDALLEKHLSEAIGAGLDPEEAKKKLDEFRRQLQQFDSVDFPSGRQNQSADSDDATSAEPEALVVENEEFDFKLNIPPGFRVFDNIGAEATVLKAFVQKNATSAKIPTIIEIHRLKTVLDSDNNLQLLALRRSVGKPKEKMPYNLGRVPTEIWQVAYGVGHLGNYTGYTLFVPLKQEALRISIGGQESNAAQNLNHLRFIANSLEIPADRLDSRGYKSFTDQNSDYVVPPSSSGQDYSSSEYEAVDRSSRARGTGIFGDGIFKWALFGAAACALLFYLYSVFTGNSESYP